MRSWISVVVRCHHLHRLTLPVDDPSGDCRTASDNAQERIAFRAVRSRAAGRLGRETHHSTQSMCRAPR